MSTKTTQAFHTHGPRPGHLPWLSAETWAKLAAIPADHAPTLMVEQRGAVTRAWVLTTDGCVRISGVYERREGEPYAMETYIANIWGLVSTIDFKGPVITATSPVATDSPVTAPALMPTRKRRGT
jgi:hypothetical protein